MKSTLTALEDNKVKLSVEVDEETFESALDQTFRKLAGELNVPGFRKGKAPRKVLESRIGSDYARAQALQDSIPDYYATALIEHDVDAIAPPELEITSGEEAGPISFDAVVETRPLLTIAGYADLTIEVPSPEPTSEEIDGQIDTILRQFADLEEVGTPAIDGNHVSIDVKATTGGEPIPGLTADDYLYEVGSGGVVPEFDEELRGTGAGHILDFSAKHPSEEGELIRFRILVKQVNKQVLPELTDEWVEENSEFGSVAALTDDVTERIAAMKRGRAGLVFQQRLVEKLGELVTDDPPQAMIDGEATDQLQKLALSLRAQGASLEEWFEASGKAPDQLQTEIQESAAASVKVDLALRAVAAAQSVVLTDEDVDAEIEHLASHLDEKPATVRVRLEGADGLMAVRSDVTKRKAFDWLIEHVSIVDENTGEAIDRAVLEPPDAEPTGSDEHHEHDEHDELSESAGKAT